MAKRTTNKKTGAELSTDVVARSVYNNLLSDFRAIHQGFGRSLTTAAEPIASIRDNVFPDYSGTTTARFRAYYQLESLFKKYRFQNDTMTSDELKEATYQKYNDFQVRRSTYTTVRCRSPRAPQVLQTARRICREILGELDLEEVLRECRFGRNSSVGCNFASAYLDVKFTKPEAFTSTVSVRHYFERILSQDALLARAFSGRVTCLHDVLPLIQVPKKYNINRTITPLTLIALWFSYGLGVVVENRLRLFKANGKTVRLDIRRLQAIHQKLVQRYSRTGSHATLDMSYGSENITSWILRALLPYQWYKAIMATTTRTVTQDGTPHYVESVLPMGNGVTFPVETLIFYSLIRAAGEHANVTGRYSAYGDDLIVPKGAVPAVYALFDDLGIVINKEKSFYQGEFRESCGADYYRGAAVRPFYMPEGMKYRFVTSKRYTSYLYKVFNGLCARWSPLEIPQTLRMLFTELVLSTGGRVLVVPPSFPDGSGVKVHDLTNLPVPSHMYWVMPEFYSNDFGTRSYRFDFLCEKPKKRVATTTLCYYWDSLRSRLETSDVRQNTFTGLENLFHVQLEDQLNVQDRWTSVVLRDHLRYLKYSSPSSLTYSSKTKEIMYKGPDGKERKKKRVKWTAWTPDKQRSTFVVQSAGREPYLPSHEGMDPLITDWI